MEPVLTFRQLSKTLPGDNRLLFSRVSGQVMPGDRVVIVGASGQGKSTLLRILARLTAPDEGELHWRGTPAAQISGRQWRQKISYVFQQAHMLPGTVEDNLRTVSRLHKLEFDSEAAREWMDRIGLGNMDWNSPANDLSGGEKQRVALVRSLLLKPDVLLLDEATASLDETSKRSAEKMLNDWQNIQQAALIWVTHDREQSRRVAERIWTMEKHTLTETYEYGVVH